MLEIASVVTIDEVDASDMSFDAHPVENMPTTPTSILSSDQESVTTIQSVVITATDKLDARDIALDAEVIAGASTLSSKSPRTKRSHLTTQPSPQPPA